MAEFSLPRHTLTKAEHDALMAHRQRPLTDDPIRLRRTTPQLPDPDGSPIDPIIASLQEHGYGRTLAALSNDPRQENQ